MKRFCWLMILGALTAPAAGQARQAGFTKKPIATRAGDKVRIEFAVDRETDVSVFVQDAGGRVVRHLVAGVLGKNPPAPLKAGSLAQSVEWDGRDDFGKPAASGPFKVRVALGLGIQFDKILLGGGPKDGVRGGSCLATGPDGTLYTVPSFGAGGPDWGGQKLIAVNRDGTYQKTLWPCPAGLSKEQMQAWGANVLDLAGRPAPLVSTIKNQNFISLGIPRKGGMAVTPGGVILSLHTGGRIAAVGANGLAPWGQRVGPVLVPGVNLPDGSRKSGRGDIAVSSDGKFAYVSGLKSAVYRVPLPARGPAELFFGDPQKPGNDETHLCGAVRGVAVDGQGHVLIADFANNRVVAVSEKDGKFAGAIPVAAPDCVKVDPATGSVYLTRVVAGAVELVRLKSWKEPQELARLTMPARGNSDYPGTMALDATAKPPLLWMSFDGGDLLRIEDQGAKFGEPRPLKSAALGDGAFVDITVDRFSPEPDIFVRSHRYAWFRFSEKTGEFSQVILPVGQNAGSCLVPGPDGQLYTLGWPYLMSRFDRSGKPQAWDNPHRGEVIIPESGGKKYVWRPTDSFVPVSMTYMTHTLGVRYDGHLFVLDPGKPGGRPPKMLIEYEPSGKRVDKPVVWKVSDVAVGPKFDPQGNIYIADHLMPVGPAYPPEIEAAVGPMWDKRPEKWDQEPRNTAGHLYGSILKFSPKGGMIHWTGTDESTPRMNPFGADPFTGKPELDPALRKADYQYYVSGNVGRVGVTGAEWVRTGISHLEAFGCNCQSVRFDVDGFGRVWYPDLARFRVGILDTNGNEITRFGGYGNADDRGPEISFAWLTGVGVTDQYAYMGDSMNERFLRAKLVYATAETIDAP